MKKSCIYLLIAITAFGGCSKDSLVQGPGAKLSVSSDEISFDTIFTSTGSITRQVKIFNDNDGRLKVSRISFRKGSSSYFTFNADGRPGPEVNDIEIGSRDSIYLYVTVKIDPTTDSLPFIVTDTIDISFNENTRSISLSSYGQNAHFVKSRVITNDTTWTDERPIVIMGGVLVAEGTQLDITRGTRIYLHADAPFIIEGTLKAVGETYDSTKIVFQGDRLDRYYRDLPGSWPGIYYAPSSKNNVLKNVVVRNAYQGIVSESVSETGDYKLQLDKCVIDNCYDAGIIGVNTSIIATNTLVSNCGKNIILVKGGNYQFIHCTDVSFGNAYVPHKEPALTVADFLRQGDVVTFAPIKAEFVNCIFWGGNGTVEDEVVTIKEGDEAFDMSMTNCIFKVKERPSNATFTDVLENQEPMFVEMTVSERKYNFRLQEGSPGINAGKNTGVSSDLDGKIRTGVPDIGAYESTF